MELSKPQNPTPRTLLNRIPKHILENPLLNLLTNTLPQNYNFEIHKCIWRIEEEKQKLDRNLSILLQLP